MLDSAVRPSQIVKALDEYVIGQDDAKKTVAVAVYTPTPAPTAPCGACRQVINEFGPDALVISVCNSSDRHESTLARLLPDSFGLRSLKTRR